jgi:hypothetical protein
MNYSFQMWGIPPTDPDGAGPLAGRVDYSSDDLPDLNEDKNLSEPAGIGDGTDTTQYVCPTGGWGFGPGTGAIDWNCNNDGGVETGVSVDINGDGVVNGLANPLTGYDDWDKLKFDFQNASPNFEDGFHLTSDVQEMDYLTYLQIPASMAIDIKPFSDPNSIDSRAKGVVPVAICNGGPVSNRVDIPDPSNPNGFDNALTNIDVSSIEFAVNASGDPLGAKVAGAEHNLSDPFVLGGHLTEYIDSDFDGIPDRLVPIDAPNCPGDPAGPDLVVHFRTRNTGLASGHTKACVTAKLAGGATIIGCDSVNVVK